jgi:hypothetical protein
VIYGRYVVTGSRAYRGHTQGTQFVARIDPNAESRAIARGDIQLLGRIEPSVSPAFFTPPAGWLASLSQSTEGAGRRPLH